MSDTQQSKPVEAIIISPVAEFPLVVGLYRAGTVTLYEDRTMTVKWEDADYGEELFEGVMNGAQVALAVQSMR